MWPPRLSGTRAGSLLKAEVIWRRFGGTPTATLNVKNFPDALYEKLKTQARREGRSVASEVKVILAEELIRSRKYMVDDSRDDRDSVTVRRRSAEDVELASTAELRSLKETVRLLRSPRNVARLLAALDRAGAHNVRPPSPGKDLKPAKAGPKRSR
jgi:PHD/YefM family antitoxin component YafN of YafNO toxin-antitoxin module